MSYPSYQPSSTSDFAGGTAAAATITYAAVPGFAHIISGLAFSYAGFNIKWEGEGINEKGVDVYTGKIMIEIDPELYRPAEVPILQGNYSKAKTKLGWSPKCNFQGLVEWMTEYDIKKYEQKKYANSIYQTNNS